jgi:hypothetical protein
MKRKATAKDVVPLARMGRAAAAVPTGEAFRPEWIDFDNGIRVGNLEPHERITQILKYNLETRHDTAFVTDRWGRGVYWQWICWLPRANREAKPVSSGVNFGCAKLFITVDREKRAFEFGLQVERGYLSGNDSGNNSGWTLGRDWDWHRLLAQCSRGTPLDAEIDRLVGREGFRAEVNGSGAGPLSSAAEVKAAARRCPGGQWAGFQLYYPMPEKEVRSCTGLELTTAVLGAFLQVVPAMNACMQVPLSVEPSARFRV